VLFRGIDSGEVDGLGESIRFERSLGIADARGADVLLAYAMNGEPLPVQHGYPLRVIVPGWYAVASVKWLAEIEVIGDAFEGHYQTGSYFYEWQRDGMKVTEPVKLQKVRSLVIEPDANAEIERGEVAIRGVAWSGAAPIARVDVSINGGPWREARLVGDRKQHSWHWWECFLRVDEPGTLEIRTRATDQSNQTQPDDPEWNRLGYGNNAIQNTRVVVR
jgi:DMSO/TMAO reductase YedYZ molybdopterin-dependent catalytic subunit